MHVEMFEAMFEAKSENLPAVTTLAIDGLKNI